MDNVETLICPKKPSSAKELVGIAIRTQPPVLQLFYKPTVHVSSTGDGMYVDS